MGLYEKGTYGGVYGTDRQSARDRYLELLAKQRMNDQLAADRGRARIEREQKDASYQNAGNLAAKGGNMGYSMSGGNPIAAVIGTVVGKGIGAVQHGREHGFGEGLKAFVDPFSTPKAFLGMGGGSVDEEVGQQVADAKNDRLAAQMEYQKQSGGDGGFQLQEPGELEEPQQQDHGLGAGQLTLDKEFALTDEDKAYYGRYGR